jgi:hypothetical protein
MKPTTHWSTENGIASAPPERDVVQARADIASWLRFGAMELRDRARPFAGLGAEGWAKREAERMEDHARWVLAGLLDARAEPAAQAATVAPSLAPGPSPHQEQDAEEMAKHLAEKHGIAYPVELGGLASWILAVVGARNQTIRERDAAQATAERLRAALQMAADAYDAGPNPAVVRSEMDSAIDYIRAALAAAVGALGVGE